MTAHCAGAFHNSTLFKEIKEKMRMCPHEKKLARRRAGNLNDCTTTAVGQLLFLLNHGASTLLKQYSCHEGFNSTLVVLKPE